MSPENPDIQFESSLSGASPKPPQVSMIIVTHNSLPALQDCLRAIPEAARSVTYDITVVDNASTDGSPDKAADFEHTTVVRLDENIGFAAACNRGARESKGTYLLFLNPDLRMDPGTIAKLWRVSEEHEQAGLVTGRLRFPDGSFQATCRQFPTAGNIFYSRGSVLSRWLGRSREPKVDKETAYTLPDYDQVTEVLAVAAAMVMIHRSLFTKLGGFDTRFFLYMEDTDLSLRVNGAG
ncbi:glycosyltransferase, partial [candidate division GN15 bacterium]|nr:glycosyltransferase [candidate division GN15 bacterium]